MFTPSSKCYNRAGKQFAPTLLLTKPKSSYHLVLPKVGNRKTVVSKKEKETKLTLYVNFQAAT
jgi:hypothetical protein